jgi:hypothetical protein
MPSELSDIEPTAAPSTGHDASGDAPTAHAEPVPDEAADPLLVDDADPVPDEADPVPDEAELARVARPALVRRAPKFGAFVTAGTLAGAVVGLVLALVVGLLTPGAEGTGFISFLDGDGSARLLTALAGAVAGALVGGALAVVADRRSVRGR